MSLRARVDEAAAAAGRCGCNAERRAACPPPANRQSAPGGARPGCRARSLAAHC
eukprot:gene8070-12932_t